MLADAGFTHVRETDCTEAFIATLRAWLDAFDTHRGALVPLLGRATFEERQADRRAQLRATEDGILRRSLYVATRP